MCVLFGRIFDWAPVGICHARVGDDGTCSQVTVNCSKKNAAHDRGIEPASAFDCSATPPPRVSCLNYGVMLILVNTCNFWVWQNFNWAPVGFCYARLRDDGLLASLSRQMSTWREVQPVTEIQTGEGVP